MLKYCCIFVNMNNQLFVQQPCKKHVYVPVVLTTTKIIDGKVVEKKVSSWLQCKNCGLFNTDQKK